MQRDILTNVQTERQRLLKKREKLLDSFTKVATAGQTQTGQGSGALGVVQDGIWRGETRLQNYLRRFCRQAGNSS